VGRILATVVFAVCLFAFSSPAHAILIPVGNTTVDTATGLAWLDLTDTDGMSPAEALAANPGFRLALNTEVMTLFLNGGMTAGDGVSRPQDFADATNLVALLGATLMSATTPSAQGWAADSVFAGVFRDPFVQANTISLTGRATFGNFFGPADGIDDVGVFLVTAMPEEETALLLVFGGLGLVGINEVWRRRGAKALARRP
jgi:hypothetical protein